MSSKAKSLLAMICVVVILASMICIPASAVKDEPDGDGETLVLAYTEIPMFLNGNYLGVGYILDSVTYVPMLAFCEAMLLTDFEASWDQETSSVALRTEDLDISMKLSDNYIVANGRYFYIAEGAYNINGTVIAPIRELARIFNVSVDWDEDKRILDIDTSDLEILQSGDEFYNEDDLYWLSHVIFSESGAEPLEGMIGVGNVVLNRVADDSGAFEDTIEDVIFQPGQFSVAETGAVYLDPNEESVVAAKLCLEGYNTVDDSKFFLNPEISSSKWFKKYKTYVTSIADHDFYA